VQVAVAVQVATVEQVVQVEQAAAVLAEQMHPRMALQVQQILAEAEAVTEQVVLVEVLVVLA
jgi:hypothetical protein